MFHTQLKPWLFLFAHTFFLLLAGQLLAGRQGLLLAFIISVFANIATYFYSDQMILKTYNAKRVEGVDSFHLNQTLVQISRAAEITPPKIYVLPSETPNALSIGRSPSSASILITDGLLRRLDTDELQAVLAHEISHIQNADTFIGMIVSTLASSVMLLAQALEWMAHPKKEEKKQSGASLLLWGMTAPFAAILIRIVTRSSREFRADQKAAQLTGNPQALATALWKIHNYSLSLPMPATEATAHNFIINPMRPGFWKKLFNTHPPTELRIKKLIGRTL